MSLLGLDIGTTGTKGVAFNLDGEVIASAYREYPLYAPEPGWQELDPEEVWDSVKAVLSEVAQKTASDPIQAMAISAQGEACHPVDSQGACLANSIVTFDGRTADMPEWWDSRIARLELARITGMPLQGIYSLNKILWWKRRQPEIFEKADKFLCYEDFVHLRLGLEPVMSHSLAARTMALDVKAGDWSAQVLDIAGVPRAKLPRTAPPGEPVGTIPPATAKALGLPPDVLVVTGGHDQPAGALGAGITSGGEAMYATGTVECIAPIFDAFTMTTEMARSNLCCYPSCIPGLYASIAFNFTGGSLLKWYRDVFGLREKELAEQRNEDVYDLICSEVPEAPETLLVLPHFTMTGTPHFDTASRGALLGMDLQTSRGEVVSAILSGVVYEMKLNVELLQAAGVELKLLKAVGGGAKSRVWAQRKADIMGIPVGVPEVTEAGALGVAMLSGKAAGLIADLRETAAEWVRLKETFEPDAKKQAAYKGRFDLYKEIYPALKSINHGLTKLKDSSA